MSFYIVLTGKSSSLSSQLTRAYRLRGEWEMAVTSLIITPEKSTEADFIGPAPKDQQAKISTPTEQQAKMYWVMCDVADYSNVNDIPMQLLDIAMSNIKKNIRPMYVKVIKKTFTSINVQLKEDPNREDTESTAIDITCILHFRKA